MSNLYSDIYMFFKQSQEANFINKANLITKLLLFLSFQMTQFMYKSLKL
jgi:hypothetical protein